MTRTIIIGASDAGISAALRIRELDPAADVTVLSKDAYPNFSICGLPFFIGGEVADWHTLAHRSLAELEATGTRFRLEHHVTGIDAGQRRITAMDRSGSAITFTYDRLVIATGAEPVRPKISGSDLPGVFTLRFMDEGIGIFNFIAERRPRSALIIGGGYIGMEMADALHRRGLSVTLADIGPTVMPTLDAAFGMLLQEALESVGVAVSPRTTVTAIEASGAGLIVRGLSGSIGRFDMVLVAAGVRPSTVLAAAAGIDIGASGAIRVNRRMETNIPGIYAAGDCAETWHRLLGAYAYMPLGSTAHKQGRVAGENACGVEKEFSGVLGTQTVKVLHLVAARTGVKPDEATAAGFEPFSIRYRMPDHKAYYPGAREIQILLTGDRRTHRLLGAQLIGHFGTEIAKRVDIFASAIHAGMTVPELAELDLSYTPPLSSPWDPVQTAALEWTSAVG